MTIWVICQAILGSKWGQLTICQTVLANKCDFVYRYACRSGTCERLCLHTHCCRQIHPQGSSILDQCCQSLKHLGLICLVLAALGCTQDKAESCYESCLLCLRVATPVCLGLDVLLGIPIQLWTSGAPEQMCVQTSKNTLLGLPKWGC